MAGTIEEDLAVLMALNDQTNKVNVSHVYARFTRWYGNDQTLLKVFTDMVKMQQTFFKWGCIRCLCVK